MQKYYTYKEVAELTGYKPKTLEQYRKLGQIKGVKLGNSWRFTEDNIKDFIEFKKKQGAKK